MADLDSVTVDTSVYTAPENSKNETQPIVHNTLHGRPLGVPSDLSAAVTENEQWAFDFYREQGAFPPVSVVRKELGLSKKKAKKLVASLPGRIKAGDALLLQKARSIGWHTFRNERLNSKAPDESTLSEFTIEEHGFCVKPDVIPVGLCEATVREMWKWLKRISNGAIKKHRPDTWVAANWPGNHRGLIQQYYAAHEPFVWKIREHDNVVAAFARIWGTQDLVTSFDGINIQTPGRTQGAGTLHVDQGSATGSALECVQGLVSLAQVDADDGCFQCIANSHRYHEEFFKVFNEPAAPDWFVFTNEHLQWYLDKPDCYLLRVPCPQGGMVLWDSRLVHCGVSPLPTREHPDRMRYIVYVCMTPRSKCTEEVMEERRRIFQERRATSHWPHKPKMFDLKPNCRGKHLAWKEVKPPNPKVAKTFLI